MSKYELKPNRFSTVNSIFSKGLGSYHKRFRILIFTLFCCFIIIGNPSSGYSQNHPLTLAPNKAITQYDHTVWQSKNGLLQNSVTSIIQSSDGYLWIGTYDGICRFDGSDFNDFERQNSSILKNSYIYSILESANKTLWIGTARAGLISYKNGKFVNHLANGQLPFRTIKAIVEDSSGNLWLGTNDHGIVRYHDGKYHVYKDINSQKIEDIDCITVRKNNEIWFGTDRKGIIIYKDGKFSRFTKKNGLNTNRIRTLYEDQSGRMWIGTAGGGINVLDHGRIRYIKKRNGLTSNIIDAFLIDREGTKWIGTEGGGLDRIVNGKITHFTTFQGLSNDVIGSLYEDKEGDLWIGTLGGGLNKIRDGKFTTYTTREGLTNNFVWSVCRDSRHRLWIGTNGGGINILHNKVVHVIDTSNGLSSNYVRSVYKAQNGSMWAGTYHGVNIIKKGKIVRKLTRKNGLSSNKILAINEDSHQNIWIGTARGLDRYKNGKITQFTTQNGLPDNYIRTIYFDHDDQMWIGTKGGLALMQKGSFKKYTVKDGLSSNDVISIYQDHSGTYWIGTFWGGIDRLKNGTFKALTSSEGLPDNVIYSIFEDARHNLWFSCNKGIFRISIKELNDYANGKIDIVSPTLYGNAEGLKNTECNGGNYPAAWQTSGGKLWFPTVGGVTMIDPNNLRKNTVPPNVHIEAAVIDNKTNIFNKKNHITAGNHRIIFHYTAISLTSSEHVAFKYKLTGFDQDWVSAGNRRSAYYTNLPPGTYTFKVIASNNDRVWNTKGASFSFTIPTPFYETYWAYSLYSISLFMMLFGFIRWQSEVTRRKELEKFEKEQLKLKAEQEHLQRLATESEARERENQLRLKAQQKEIAFEKERREHELSVATAFAQGVEDERDRIARELHDQILGSLSIIMRRIQKVIRKFQHQPEQSSDKKIFADDIQDILPDLDKIGQDIRQIMDDLKPGTLEFFGLVEALEGLLNKQIDSFDRPIKLKVTAPDKITTMDSFTKITVFRIFQEAVNNAIKHAAPNQIELLIEDRGDIVIFKLIDDGVGFDYHKTIKAIKHRKDKGGHGLMNMLHRATTINAQISWKKASPHGTIMKLIIPLNN